MKNKNSVAVPKMKGIQRQNKTSDQATWTAPELPFGEVKNSGFGRPTEVKGGLCG
jgi:hypothetical protein